MCSDAPAPDENIGKAALANVELSKEMIQYYRERDKAQAPRQAQMDELATKIANQSLSAATFNDQQAREMWDRYKETGIPMENLVNQEALNYDSKEAQDRVAGQAATDVAAQMGMARDAQMRNLARAGVNPADGRSLAMESDQATAGALATAGAMNKARSDRELQGVMLRKDAASMARGMPGTAAQTFGVAQAAGSQAQGAVGSAIGAANSITGTMGQGFNGAISANNSAASILNQQHSNQIAAANSGGLGEILGAAGSLGMGLGALGVSDKNQKENRQPVDDDKALEGIRKTPVESWTYKDDSVAADGGKPHVGAMAQDMRKNLGEQVAPGGKMVDLISAVGVTMSAVKALDKKVDKLAGKGKA